MSGVWSIAALVLLPIPLVFLLLLSLPTPVKVRKIIMAICSKTLAIQSFGAMTLFHFMMIVSALTFAGQVVATRQVCLLSVGRCGLLLRYFLPSESHKACTKRVTCASRCGFRVYATGQEPHSPTHVRYVKKVAHNAVSCQYLLTTLPYFEPSLFIYNVLERGVILSPVFCGGNLNRRHKDWHYTQ